MIYGLISLQLKISAPSSQPTSREYVEARQSEGFSSTLRNRRSQFTISKFCEYHDFPLKIDDFPVN